MTAKMLEAAADWDRCRVQVEAGGRCYVLAWGPSTGEWSGTVDGPSGRQSGPPSRNMLVAMRGWPRDVKAALARRVQAHVALNGPLPRRSGAGAARYVVPSTDRPSGHTAGVRRGSLQPGRWL